MKSQSLRPLCWPLFAGLLLWASGCAQSETQAPKPSGSAACTCAEEPIVDPTLMAFLSKARAAHHDADLAEDKGDREAAVRVLSRVVEGPSPASAKPSPEVNEVMADTYARLADLRSAGGDFDAALKDIDQGLKLAQTVTHFRGHLIEVRGLVFERRAKALKEKGDEPGAASARDAALKAFEEAIDIQDQVIRNALGEGPAKEKGSGTGSKP